MTAGTMPAAPLVGAVTTLATRRVFFVDRERKRVRPFHRVERTVLGDSFKHAVACAPRVA